MERNFNRDFYCQFALFEKDRMKERKIEKQIKKNRTLCHNSGPLSAYVCTPERLEDLEMKVLHRL